MKRYLNVFIVLMMMLSMGSLFADTWTEDFESNPSTAYADASVTISGRVWTKVQAGNFSYANTAAGSYGFTINDDVAGAHITTPVLNTIGTVSFKYAYINGSDTNVFVLQKSYDNANFVDLDTHTLGASANQNYVDYSYDINDSATEIYIRILSDNQNAHLFIDDFSVTDAGSGPLPLSADFSADYVTGLAPLTINFTPAVTGGTEPYGYSWDFDNDGNVDSTTPNPSHTYSTPGTYSVKLTIVDGALGTDVEEKINYITVLEESGTSEELMTNGDLELWDNATTPTGWDVIENIQQEGTIIHSGYYSAKQTAGTKDLRQDVTGLIAGQSYTISYWYLDNDPNARSRMWSYWLSGTSTNSDNVAELRPDAYSTDNAEWQQITHTLTAPAGVDGFRFEVRTYNEGANGGVIYYDDFSVMGASGTTPELLSVDFEADVLTGQVPLTVNFTNLVTGGVAPYLYSWDFDNDGMEDSSQPNPTFTYNAVGTYPVELYVMDSGTSDGTEYKTAYITVTTSGGNTYYSGITATEGTALKSQLKTLISTNTNTSYDGARAAMYSNIDNINNTVTCVYTGLEVNHNYGNTSAPSGINTEHTYAQSWIEDYDTQSEITRAKADVHHLFPTESGVNSSRGNLSFDDVNSVEYSYSEVTGYVSYRGTNGEAVTVFEPADQHKGDLARALLYMNVRYDLPLAPPIPNNGPININMLPTLLEWHGQDPVDVAEITRNDEIHDYQGNRNPFVDNPAWVNAIYGGDPIFTCATPTMNPAGGTFDSIQNVTITTTTADADIYYTTNGNIPTSASTLYTGPVQVAADMTIKAIAVKAGWNDSQMATEAYNINIIPTVSIYDIQYVADPGTSDVSAYDGQTVNVTGIVTAVDGNNFYLSAPAGGPWNSIFVYASGQTPLIGDQVTFNGQVAEYQGLTELVNINSFQTLSHGNSVAQTVINTNQINEEQYESSLVTFQNVTVTIAPDYNNQWYVSDGSGDAQIDDLLYYPLTAPILGNVYSSITGVISYSFGSFEVNPRFEADVILDSSVNQLPVLTNVAHSPALVYPDDAVTVSADAVDNDGTIATINLKWGTATGVYTTTTAMTPSRATYTAEIPAQLEGTSVYYVVQATDNESGLTTSDERTYTVNAEPGEGVATELFFSEYIEGGSYNKAIEIFNGTGAPVDLSLYTIKYGSNGAAYGNPYALTDSGLATLANNDVLVLAHGSANATILAAADATPSIINHNGDDAYGLFKNDVLIDVIGVAGSGDPGSGWAVGGDANATANHTLVRKPTVSAPTTDWAVSAGTNVDDSQWIIYPQDESSYIGSHQFDGGGTVTPDVVATPVISPAEGQYNDEVEITITCATDGATIYYTLDGNDPTTASSVYSGPFSLNVDTTVKAFAILADYDDSAIASAVYTIVETGDIPTGMLISEYIDGSSQNKAVEIYNGSGAEVDLTPYSVKLASNGGDWGTTYDMTGTLAAGQVFVIGNSNASAEIQAVTDATSGITFFNGNDAIGLFYNDVAIDVIGVQGLNPGTGWDVAGITEATADHTLVRKTSVTEGTTNWTLSAGTNAVDSQWIVYDYDTFGYLGTYGIEPTPTVATPVISPAEGQYNDEVQVSITCATDGATIYYTLDGNDPTTASSVYSGPFSLNDDTTVKAFATKADYNDSAIASALYTVLVTPTIVETPVITPATGTYYTEQEVSITCATDGATIYYTTNGSAPTTSSLEYQAPFMVSATTTVKALAVKAELTDSEIAESIITIEELIYTPGMIISEYIEGSSNHKAIEIYNGTGADVDLTPYTVRLGSNGGDWGNTCDMQGILAAGDVYVIANAQADAAIIAVSDTTSNITYYNGDDAVGLLYNDVLIDVVGTYQTDPGTAWDVAGVTGATLDHTLVRKNSVTQGTTDWAISAGTDASDSQWIVYPINTFAYLGFHGIDVVAIPEISPNGGSYTDEVEVSITCLTDGATIYYTLDGSDPTTASLVYSGPFSLNADATVKAFATKADYTDSEIASADFTIVSSGDVPTGMIISEYIEGSSNNKAIEIYNGTGEEVDLTPYVVKLGANGGDWGNTCDMVGTLAAGDVFVIANAGADAAIIAVSDTTSTVTYFNGDDAIGLFYNDVLIDVFGTYLTDPGTGWEVAGLANATVDKTLVRKLTVTQGTTDWATSAGTDASDSQWIIYPTNTFDMLGSHTAPLAVVAAPVINPDGGDYQDQVVVTITSATPNALIYYTLDNSTPTDASTLYTGSITLTADATVKAIAMKNDMITSTMTTAVFTVTQVTFEDGITVSETAMTFTSEVGTPSDTQSYTLYMQAAELALVEVTGDFQIQDPDGAWGSDFFFELVEQEVVINVKFNATNPGTAYGEIIHSIDGFDDVVIDLTGTGTEVLPTSIYDIQYVADPATNDASPYDGQEVIVEGIVTANNYGGKYFISAPEGGAWNAIYVYDTANDPALGDLVRIRATVDEYYNWTELTSVTEYEVLSQGNTIPAPVVITTAELASMEAYESVLVTIENVTVSTAANSYGEWYVTDGSGDAQIDDNCYPIDPAVIVGDTFASITGVVDYSYNNYGLNPRSADDFVIGGGVTELDTPVITSITKVATGIEIIWNSVDNANSYVVWGSDAPDGTYSEVTTTGNTTYIFTGTDGMKFFKVKAYTEGIAK
ncbi:chitobiase/beta-hexosaminidase C-terminal domain-containing protein [bacterium]|nr:chitobiase/beta-hexosaminidase C-terminal domain-containing protein [bacterium]